MTDNSSSLAIKKIILSLNTFYICEIEVISLLHGAHQLAQKLIKIGLPNRSINLIGVLFKSVKDNCSSRSLNLGLVIIRVWVWLI